MNKISISIPSKMRVFIKKYIKDGHARNVAEVVHKALALLAEQRAIDDVLQAERELSEGKGLRGDLRELAKKLK